jgi:hypothetical protein
MGPSGGFAAPVAPTIGSNDGFKMPAAKPKTEVTD